MSDLKNMRKIKKVFLIQVLAFFIILAAGISIILKASSLTPFEFALSAFLFSVVGFCCHILLFGMWSILINFAENWWSIRAKQRIRNWQHKPEFVAILVSFFALFYFGWALIQIEGLADVQISWISIFAIVLISSAAIPFITSAILAAGSIRRVQSLQKYVTDLSLSLNGHKDLQRPRASILSLSGKGTTNSRPAPKGFYFMGLPSKPWHESNEFPWIEKFENAYDLVLKEAKIALGNVEDLDHYHYPGVDTSDWRTFQFIRDGVPIRENLASSPVTAGLLKEIPGYPLIREAIFSILEPGGVIPPHRDEANLYLTMHYGVLTPTDGYMEVAGIRRPWTAGQSIIFDSSYHHQAINKSDKPRVILLVDFLNPNISEAEREWVAKAPL